MDEREKVRRFSNFCKECVNELLESVYERNPPGAGNCSGRGSAPGAQAVGTEHILLGILKLNDPLIEGLFASLHTSTARVIEVLEYVVGRGNKSLLGESVLSSMAHTVLVFAEREAIAAQAELVGVPHLLLVGLYSERDGVTVGVLESFGCIPQSGPAAIYHSLE